MLRPLVRMALLALLLGIPAMVGCGSDNKTDIPTAFKPPPTDAPKVEGGGPKGGGGDGVAPPKK